MRTYEISETDVKAIEEATFVLRDHIQARGAQTEESLEETRKALSGLLGIIPKAVVSPIPARPWRGPETPGAA